MQFNKAKTIALIKKLRKQGNDWKTVADILNEKGLTTAQGRKFTGANACAMIPVKKTRKKTVRTRRKRDSRLALVRELVGLKHIPEADRLALIDMVTQ